MRTKYSIYNSITAVLNNVITFGLLFVVQTFIVKLLGIEYSGLNGLFSNIITVLSLIELGIGNAIVYNLYKYIKKDDKETIKSLIAFYKKAYNRVALFVFIIGLLILPFIKYIVNDVTADVNIYYVYLLILMSTVVSYIMAYKRSVLFSYQRNYVMNIIHIICVIILNSIQLLILYYTRNYYLFLIIKILFVIIENIIINFKVNREYEFLKDKDIKPLDKNIENDIYKKVKALFVHKSSSVVTTGTDNIIISVFFGISTLGMYMNYYYIISSIQKLFVGIVDAARASVGNLIVDKDSNHNYLVFKKILFLNYFIAVITTVCLLCLIDPFITAWLGDNYLFDKITLIVILINYFQTVMRTTFSIFKDSAGIWVEDKYVPVFQMLINLGVSIVMAYWLGLVGVFIGTIVSSFVLWFYSYPKFVYKGLLNKEYKQYYKDMIKMFVVFILCCSISYIIVNMIVIPNIVFNLIVKLLVCLLIVVIILLLLNYKKDECKYYIDFIRNIDFKKKQ